jgi:hypothetical protein
MITLVEIIPLSTELPQRHFLLDFTEEPNQQLKITINSPSGESV